MRNTPRVNQEWVGDGGEPLNIRNEICLNKVGVSALGTRVLGPDDDGCGHQEEPSCVVHDEHSSAR